jgi:hypothetical protein
MVHGDAPVDHVAGSRSLRMPHVRTRVSGGVGERRNEHAVAATHIDRARTDDSSFVSTCHGAAASLGRRQRHLPTVQTLNLTCGISFQHLSYPRRMAN